MDQRALHTHRARQVGASVERQWAKSLRGGAPLSARGPFRTGNAPFLPPIELPSGLQRQPPVKQYLPTLSPLEVAYRVKPHVPMRNFTYGGNENGNPSYYPLPLGKCEFSTRCG